MKIVCSHCEASIGQKAPFDDDGVTHGMCLDCAAHCRRLWRGLNLGQYLDQFDTPVLVVDDQQRPLAANGALVRQGAEIDFASHALVDTRVVECASARLPRGCGCAQHCCACAVRLGVRHTLLTGEPCEPIPTTLLPTKGASPAWLVSTRRVGEIVQVLIEETEAAGRGGSVTEEATL